MEEIISETNADEELQSLKSWLAQTKRKLPTNLVSYCHVASEVCQTENGVLLRGTRIIVPNSLRKKTIQLAHQGHQGIMKTKALIRSKVWFPSIDRMVEETFKSCIVCQTQFAPLKPSKMPDGPWQEVSGDFFAPMSDGTYYSISRQPR